VRTCELSLTSSKLFTHLKQQKKTTMTINCFKAAIERTISFNTTAIGIVSRRSNVNCGDAIQLYTEAIKNVQEMLVATITDPNSTCEHQCHLHVLPHMISVSAHRTSHQQEFNLVDSSTESSLVLPPNALPIYNCLFDLQINYFKDDDNAAAPAYWDIVCNYGTVGVVSTINEQCW
jgi:hypothetical protein